MIASAPIIDQIAGASNLIGPGWEIAAMPLGFFSQGLSMR
jgi:hypothetical protein